MCPLKDFTPMNPTGEAPGMEPVNVSLLQAVVAGPVESTPPPRPVLAPRTAPAVIAKTIRLPTDLVDFIDYVYTKEQRMRKQDAYTQALEQVFRPLMEAYQKRG